MADPYDARAPSPASSAATTVSEHSTTNQARGGDDEAAAQSQQQTTNATAVETKKRTREEESTPPPEEDLKPAAKRARKEDHFMLTQEELDAFKDSSAEPPPPPAPVLEEPPATGDTGAVAPPAPTAGDPDVSKAASKERWRAHQTAEEYVEMASNLVLNPTVNPWSSFGYNPAALQYPLEARNTLSMLKSPIRRVTIIEQWAPLEIAMFEASIAIHGKQFHKIAREIKTKSTKQAIDFYYIWKKTKHYKKWKKMFVPPYLDHSDSEDEPPPPTPKPARRPRQSPGRPRGRPPLSSPGGTPGRRR